MRHPATGIRRIGKAFLHSTAGFKHLVKHEAAFQQELCLVLPLLPVILYSEATHLQKLLLFCSLLLILITEVINTAIEAAVDRISTEPHPLSALAKDLGSLAVLLSFILAAAVWAVVYLG